MATPGGGARVELGILGPLSLAVGGEARPVVGEKLQALLARLLLDANRAVATDRLIDELWGEEPPATARQSLHVHVGRLRRLLDGGEDRPSPLETTANGYLLRLDPADSDADHFRALVESARADLAAGRLEAAGVSFGYGSAWVSNYRGESVSVVRPGSERAESISVTGGPLGIAAGAGGIWVVAFWSQELVRIDPETRRVLRRIPIGAGPNAVAVGAGAVWVTNRDDRTISRVDPSTNRVVRTIRLAAAPHGVYFAHGRVWTTTRKCGSPVVPCG